MCYISVFSKLTLDKSVNADYTVINTNIKLEP